MNETTTIFSDGFECPPNTAPDTFTAWTSKTGTPTIVLTNVRSGTYAANLVGLGESCNLDLVSTYATIHVRFYCRLNSYVPASTFGRVVDLITINDSINDKTLIVAGLTSDGTDTYWAIFDKENAVLSASDVLAETGVYHCIEIAAFVGSVNGYMKLWIDESLEVNYALNNSTWTNARYIYLGNVSEGWFSVDENVDAVVVADAYIGIIGASATVLSCLWKP